MSERVVVTGLGVIAPNGNGLRDFELALRKRVICRRRLAIHGKHTPNRTGLACERQSLLDR